MYRGLDDNDLLIFRTNAMAAEDLNIPRLPGEGSDDHKIACNFHNSRFSVIENLAVGHLFPGSIFAVADHFDIGGDGQWATGITRIAPAAQPQGNRGTNTGCFTQGNALGNRECRRSCQRR